MVSVVLRRLDNFILWSIVLSALKEGDMSNGIRLVVASALMIGAVIATVTVVIDVVRGNAVEGDSLIAMSMICASVFFGLAVPRRRR